MRIKFLVPLLLILWGCQNTNPNQGSGGKVVESKTTLSGSAIVDSAKSVLDQSFILRQKLQQNEIDTTAFKPKYTQLMTTYTVLLESLTGEDSIEVVSYRATKSKELEGENKEKNKTPRWE